MIIVCQKKRGRNQTRGEEAEKRERGVCVAALNVNSEFEAHEDPWPAP